MQVFTTLVVAVCAFVNLVSSCPVICTCSSFSLVMDVNCNNKGLFNIPTDLPINTSNVELENNNITEIEETVFQNMTSLYEVSLNYNRITSIKTGTFRDLPNLNRVHFKYNNIALIEEHAFENLPRLQSLDFQYNMLSRLEENAFGNRPMLQSLRIANNNISYVDSQTFQNLPNLTQLIFSLHCNCNNIPFWKWLTTEQRFTSSITCYDHGVTYLASFKPCDFGSCYVDPCYSNSCSNNGLCSIDDNDRAVC